MCQAAQLCYAAFHVFPSCPHVFSLIATPSLLASESFHLHGTLVGPDHILKASTQVLLCPLKMLPLVCLSNLLAVGTAPEGPAQQRATSKHSLQSHCVAIVCKGGMKLNGGGFIILSRLPFHEVCTAAIILVGRPAPALLSTLPVSLYFIINLFISTCLQQAADSRHFVAHMFVVQNLLPLITVVHLGHLSNTTNSHQGRKGSGSFPNHKLFHPRTTTVYLTPLWDNNSVMNSKMACICSGFRLWNPASATATRTIVIIRCCSTSSLLAQTLATIFADSLMTTVVPHERLFGSRTRTFHLRILPEPFHPVIVQ